MSDMRVICGSWVGGNEGPRWELRANTCATGSLFDIRYMRDVLTMQLNAIERRIREQEPDADDVDGKCECGALASYRGSKGEPLCERLQCWVRSTTDARREE